MRLVTRPGTLGIVLMALTLMLAGALAWQGVRSAAQHRAAVETALQHNAASAAWQFTRQARSWVGYGISEADDSLQRYLRPRAQLPGPSILATLLPQKYCDCVSAAFGRSFVRWLPGDSAIDVEGELLSTRGLAELADTMRAFAGDTVRIPGAQRWKMLPPGTPRLNRGTDVAMIWRIGERTKPARAVYAMIVERAQMERPLIGAFEQTAFFPTSVVPADQVSNLVRVSVSGPNNAPVFDRGPDEARFFGTDTIGTALGNLVATASLNPAAAQFLVAGGVPASPVPTIVGLVAVMLGVGIAGAVLMRREQKLATLREDFVSGVSHELRTPLTQIRVLSELLDTDGFRNAEERKRAVSVIHRESLRLSNLVDNILEFTRLRRTEARSSASAIILSDLLQELADMLEPLVASRENRLQIDDVSGLVVKGDADALRRILRNLIENAVKYGPASQTIRVTGERHGDGIRLTVDDEGPGIPVADRARVWQPYFRLDRDRNAPGGGTGLGLSVVADLVRRLDGRVMIEDAPGGGARFTLELPAMS